MRRVSEVEHDVTDGPREGERRVLYLALDSTCHAGHRLPRRCRACRPPCCAHTPQQAPEMLQVIRLQINAPRTRAKSEGTRVWMGTGMGMGMGMKGEGIEVLFAWWW